MEIRYETQSPRMPELRSLRARDVFTLNDHAYMVVSFRTPPPDTYWQGLPVDSSGVEVILLSPHFIGDTVFFVPGDTKVCPVEAVLTLRSP